MNNTGIYKITNLLNGNFYIGSAASKGGFKSRWYKHLFLLKNKNHHSKHLQSAWDKYGKNSFVFEIIEIIENRNSIIIREQYYLDTLKPEYNTCKIAGSPLGVKHTDETRLKMSKRKMGIHLSEEHKKNIGLGNIGKIVSEKTRTKLRNKIKTKEAKLKISKANSGEKHGMSKLTISEVKSIREEYLNNVNLKTLSEKYKLSNATIFNIVNNISYKDDNYQKYCINKKDLKLKNKKLGDEIRNYHKNNKNNYTNLSEIFNMSRTQISRIINNKIYN